MVDGKAYALKRVNVGDMPTKMRIMVRDIIEILYVAGHIDNTDSLLGILLLTTLIQDLQDCLNEIRILASFQHPRIVRWYETFIESSTDELCIIMELCSYGDLETKIKRHQQKKKFIDEREIWVYTINILEGLVALHTKGVVHRDLKPANCLIDEYGCVKIADMNISKVSKGDNMQTQVFMCPEIYNVQPYTTTSDIWSTGVLLYTLAALRPPFMGDNLRRLRKAVVRGNYDPLPRVYSQNLGAMIDKFLQVNPSDRPEAK